MTMTRVFRQATFERWLPGLTAALTFLVVRDRSGLAQVVVRDGSVVPPEETTSVPPPLMNVPLAMPSTNSMPPKGPP